MAPATVHPKNMDPKESNKIVSSPGFDESGVEEEEKEAGTEEEEIKEGEEEEEKPEKVEKKEDETEEEEGEEKEEEDEEKETEKKETEEEEEDIEGEAPAEKKYYFNGKTVTADELFAEASGLQVDHTEKSQDLAKKEEEEILAKFKPEEVETFRSLAKALGFVSKEEIAKNHAETTQKGIVTEFLKTHPEYTKVRDPAGQKYAKLQSQLRKYNLNIDNLGWALNKAHNDLSGGKDDTTTARQLANATKLKRSSVHGGGSAGGGVPKASKYTPAQIEVMKKMGVFEEKS